MTDHDSQGQPAAPGPAYLPPEGLLATIRPLARQWRLIVAAPVVAGTLAFGATFLMKPVFVAETTFLPPQSQQSSALGALASLGSLAGLSGIVPGGKSPAEQFVALMQSTTVSDRMIKRFDLKREYDDDWQDEARRDLGKRSSFRIGRKDGLITITVEDHDPRRAAAMANQYVEELRRMTALLAITDAQQRRVFFEQQMERTKQRLIAAQRAMQDSGFTADALKAEPKAAAESYAALHAQLTAQQARLAALRQSLADSSPEVQAQLALVQTLQRKVDDQTQAEAGTTSSDYVSRYREYKYQETLLESLAREYELARVDEARDGPLIQVVDVAQPPERKSRPRRGLIAATAALLALVAGLAWALSVTRRGVRSGSAA